MGNDYQKSLEKLKLLEIKAEIKKNIPHLYGFKWYIWAKAFFKSRNKFNLLCAANQISKALDVETEIPTPSGLIKLKDLKVGDYVYSSTGLPVIIEDIPYEGEDESYKITFTDDSSVIASKNHEWVCKGYRERFRKKYTSGNKGKTTDNKNYGEWQTKDTLSIIKDGKYSPDANPINRYSIPITYPTASNKEPKMDAYLLGLLLGDGCILEKKCDLTSYDEHIVNYVIKNHAAKKVGATKYCYSVRSVIPQLKQLGVYGTGSKTKFIPRECLEASASYRMALLRGLMDSDGTIQKKKCVVSYTTISERLRDDFIELVCSLGGIAKYRQYKAGYRKHDGEYKRCNDAYVISVKTRFNPFGLERKRKYFYDIEHKHERIIKTIEPVGKRKVKCLTVGGNHTFLCTRNYIVTHNSSTQIRKAIHWCTATDLWPTLWPKMIGLDPHWTPTFWYFYPTKDLCQEEFVTKWVKEFLPRGRHKDEGRFSWKPIYANGKISRIEFPETGAIIIFKSYSMKVKDVQAGSVAALFCFTKGHLINTINGLVPVENVNVGDMVLTRDGYKPVLKNISREDKVYNVKFSNGETLTGTSEHPVYTDSGFVKLKDLTQKDVCSTLYLWKLQKKLHYIKENFSLDILKTRIPGKEIIQSMIKAIVYTLLYGKIITKWIYQKIIAFITKILIHSTIVQKIFLHFLGQNTLEYIKKKNGLDVHQKKEILHVNIVEKNLLLEAHRKKLQSTVLKSVERLFIGVLSLLQSLVSGVERCLMFMGIVKKLHVVDPAHNISETTPQNIKTVYNLTVESKPEYFCNGILVHNCDEELPMSFYNELLARIRATEGYFHLVFTATLGQEFWRQALEEKGDHEKLKQAFKQQISMYDCMFYEDGSPSPWTHKKIRQAIAECSTKAEIQRRIYGKFVVDSGLMYQQFDEKANVCAPIKLNPDYFIYSAVDIGSGGESHPGAMLFIAVNEDSTHGYIFKGKRFDHKKTTAGDLYNEHFEMKKGMKNHISQVYDYESGDFKIIADRNGDPFMPAVKKRDEGIKAVNTLFKHGMLEIFDTEELRPLINELKSLKLDTAKTKAKDDMCDAARYCVMSIPWDWTHINEFTEVEKEDIDHAKSKDKTINRRRNSQPNDFECIDECAAWNDVLCEF